MAADHRDIKALFRRHGCTEIRKIGEGSFGKAILVQDDEGSRIVCKMVDIRGASNAGNKKEIEDAVAEGKLLAKLKHPFIVRYRDSFIDSDWLCILMDYAEGGDLGRRIEQARKFRANFTEDQIVKWFTQTIMALQYLHGQHILHRDLKPGNLFIAQNGSIKVGDFGIAKVLDCTVAMARTQIGTPYYLSPELCQERPYAWGSDIWAMGCILYEMCALKVPFDAANISGLVSKIVRGPLPTLPSSYSSFLRELCLQMLNRQASARPGCDEILQRREVQAIVQQIKDSSQKSNETDILGARVAASTPPAEPRQGGPFAAFAGQYKVNDAVEYDSVAHKSWLPAVVTDVDGAGYITIDLKPNTWLSKLDQSNRVRPRGGPSGGGGQPQPAAAAGAALLAPPQCGTPKRRRSPRSQSPVPGAGPDAPGSRRGSPQQRAPGRESSPVPPAVGGAEADRGGTPHVFGMYKVNDLVEYFSTSFCDWLPATVVKVDIDGRIMIDLKPNTWIPVFELVKKVRPRRGQQAAVPSSRALSPAPVFQRSPSCGGLEGLFHGAARTPSCDPAPRRAFSREPPGRGVGWAPPGGGGRCSAAGGTPRMRPPGLPGVRRNSPLHVGGRNIAGI